MRLSIEEVVSKMPAPLKKKLGPHLKLMRTRREGGRFDSKSRWIYMEPLHKLQNILEM